MPPRRASRSAPAAVGVLAFALAACSSPASGTGSTATTGAPAPTTTAPGTASARAACAAISPAQVETMTGTVVRTPRVGVRGSVATCTYPASGTGQPVVVQYASGATADLFTADRSRLATTHGPLTPVTGLGDQAYSFTTAAGTTTATTLVVLTGSLQFIVTSTSPLGRVEGLAQLVLYAVDRARTAPDTTTATTAAG